MNTEELWQKLDQIGLDEVRKKKAEGVYGEKKLPLVDEWIHRCESKDGLGEAHAMLPGMVSWLSAFILILLAIKPLRRALIPQLG